MRHDPDAEVHRCGRCELVFLWPRPSEEQQLAFYGGTYQRQYEMPPLEASLDEMRTRIERMAPLLAGRPSLLEIGSGTGGFLQAVEPHVSRLAGVEPSEGTTLADVSGTFDLIVCFHVLEHVPDPVGFLERAATRLAVGGTLGIEVPNVDDALLSVFDVPEFRQFYFQSAHLLYFSRETLARTLAAAGFAAEIAGIQRYDLSNHLVWALERRPGGLGRYPMLGAAASDAYAAALIEHGVSDTLWAVARRAELT